MPYEALARRLGLKGLLRKRVRDRLQGHHVGRVGRRINLYRLADAEAAVRAEVAVAARRAAAERTRAADIEPCPVCGGPMGRGWIIDRCHGCMRAA